MNRTLLIGKALLDGLQAAAPQLLENPTHRHLLGHAFQARRGDGYADEDERGRPNRRRAVIPYMETARCAGKIRQALSRNYRALPDLQEFLLALEEGGGEGILGKHNYYTGQARTIEISLPPALEAAWEAGERQRQTRKLAGMYFLSTLEPYTPERMRQLRKQDREERRRIARATAEHEGPRRVPDTIIAYHAAHDPDHLPTLRAGALRALAAAQRDAQTLTGRARERAETAVTALEFYLDETEDGHPVGLHRVPNSDRVYPDGTSLLTVPREYRDLAFQGLGAMVLDLHAAQLAILSVIYDCPEAAAVLRSGRSWWNNLLPDLFPSPSPAAKDPIKTATYAYLYGQKHSTTVHALTDDLMDVGLDRRAARQGCQAFFKHPLMRALGAARDRTFEQIRRDRGMKTHTGDFIPTSAHRRAHKVAAAAAQALEQRIMLAAYQAADRAGVIILQNRYDGLVVIPKRGAFLYDGIQILKDEILQVVHALDVPSWMESSPVRGEQPVPPPLPLEGWQEREIARIMERAIQGIRGQREGGIKVKVKREIEIKIEIEIKTESRAQGPGGRGGSRGQADHVSYFSPPPSAPSPLGAPPHPAPPLPPPAPRIRGPPSLCIHSVQCRS